MKKDRVRDRLLTICKVLPFLFILGLVIAFGRDFKSLSVEDILHFKPENLLLAGVLLILLYAVKSVSVVFPLVVLYIASGVMFPPFWAIMVNLAGLFLCVTIPYFIGRFSGHDLTEKLLVKYHKKDQFDQLRDQNEWFLSYILRVVGMLPGDVVSMVLGSAGTHYGNYVTGSLVGYLPAMLAATFMGATITNPLSPGFLISFACKLLISVLSLLVYRCYLQRQRKHVQG